MSLFRIEGLVKRFGGLLATDHVNLTVERGEVHALIGPNGAGKTTLVNLITGLLKADAGRILLDEKDITGFKDHQRVAAGMSRCFQVTRVFAKETVHDNLMLAAQAHAGSSLRFMAPRANERALVERAVALAERVGLGSERHRIAGTLPHGAQRALDVALALAAEPKLLLLDEPGSGLTRDEKEDLARFILRLRFDWKVSVLWIEHDLQMVSDLADRVHVLNLGECIASGIPEEVKRMPAVINAYVGDEPVAVPLEAAAIEDPVVGADAELVAGVEPRAIAVERLLDVADDADDFHRVEVRIRFSADLHALADRIGASIRAGRRGSRSG